MSTVFDRPRLTVPLGPEDHVLGRENAAVTLLEYGDYECPYCGAAHPVVKELLRMVGDDMRFAYRHFPLTQVHPHAFQAALAAEAAAAQDKFWQMHDLLFEHQDMLDGRGLLALAESLGLDVERFAHDVQERTYEEKVRRDFISGVRSGVNGTPTFFVNDVRHNGTWDIESLLEAIESAA
ncbi:MAG: DsbA family protein [Gaiellaceae bacterium]